MRRENEELILVADRAGRYIDANHALLEATGYDSVEEIRQLEPGALSDADRAASAEVWRLFVAGEIQFPRDRSVSLRRRDQSVVPAILRAVEPDGSPDTWTIRMCLGERPEAPLALNVLLSQWREAERQLGAMAPDDPERGALRARIEELRGLYHSESRRLAR